MPQNGLDKPYLVRHVPGSSLRADEDLVVVDRLEGDVLHVCNNRNLFHEQELRRALMAASQGFKTKVTRPDPAVGLPEHRFRSQGRGHQVDLGRGKLCQGPRVRFYHLKIKELPWEKSFL